MIKNISLYLLLKMGFGIIQNNKNLLKDESPSTLAVEKPKVMPMILNNNLENQLKRQKVRY
jgi:hypothetical protein